MIRRVMAVVSGGVLLAACSTTPSGSETARSENGAVTVEAPGGGVTVSMPNNMPGIPAAVPMNIISGTKVKVEGNASSPARLTFSFDAQYDGAAHDNNLFVVRYTEGMGWVPQGGVVDTEKRIVSVQTNQFSHWGLASFDLKKLEEAVGNFAKKSFYDTAFVKGTVGLLSLPFPMPSECRKAYPELKIDTSNFFVRLRQEGVCVYPNTEKLGHYKLAIANTTGLAINLKLPKGVTFARAEPERTTIYAVLSQLQRKYAGDGSVVMGSGQLMTFDVDPSQLPLGSELTMDAAMDVKYALFDAAGTLLQLALPIVVPDVSVQDQQLLEKYGKVVTCYAGAADEFAEKMKANPSTARLMSDFGIALGKCIPDVVNLAMHLMGQPNGWLDALKKAGKKVSGDSTEGVPAADALKNRLDKLLEGNLWRLVKFWENAGSMTQLFATAFTLLANNGVVTQYRLRVTISAVTAPPPTAPPASSSTGNPPNCRHYVPVPGEKYWFPPCNN